MSLKDIIAYDIMHTFLNVDDFCGNIRFQAGNRTANIIGSLQSNLIDNNTGTNPSQTFSGALYTAYPITCEDGSQIVLGAGERITLDDIPYTVVSINNEMGLATILLTKGGAR